MKKNKTDLRKQLIQMARNASEASRKHVFLSSTVKNRVLVDMARALLVNMEAIKKANRKDLVNASRAGYADAFIDRLALDEKRIRQMAGSLKEIAALPDPVGEVIKGWRIPNSLWIKRVRVPIGVIAIIYESRPNVTSDCIGLCFKSGNSVILRGGSEAINSNTAIFNILRKVIKKHGISEGMANLVTFKDRKAVDELLKLNEYIDVVIPRGGEGLIRKVTESSRIPVIKHYKGICHVYVDKYAHLKQAEEICFNAKVQRPGVCNAMESMLVHKDIAKKFFPSMIRRFREAGVEIRGCKTTREIVKGIKAAKDKDYCTEFLDLILSVKIVPDITAAIEHINRYGSHHSDAIITENRKNALKFLKLVDSACVYVNASTRFTDGYQFGMGAEIGISTDKIHARGPMALEELTTYKYMVFGSGQIRE